MQIRLRPTFDYGAHKAKLTSGSNHARFFGDSAVMRLTTDASINYILHETEFSPPLAVDGTTGTDLTLFVDLSTWFLVNGVLVDPAQANDQQPLASQVKDNIKASIRAFEDDDRDGEDDHGEHGGGHGSS